MITKPLYKTTIVIWTDYDPDDYDIDHLATQAMFGDAYCSDRATVKVEDPANDSTFPDTEFFGAYDDESEE